MPKKKLTEKMLIDTVNNLPKPMVHYWVENSDKSIESLLSYAKGFCDGTDFVIETILKPHIDRVDKIFNP